MVAAITLKKKNNPQTNNVSADSVESRVNTFNRIIRRNMNKAQQRDTKRRRARRRKGRKENVGREI